MLEEIGRERPRAEKSGEELLAEMLEELGAVRELLEGRNCPNCAYTLYDGATRRET